MQNCFVKCNTNDILVLLFRVSLFACLFLLEYVFPDVKYLERPYMAQLEKSIRQNIIKCGAGKRFELW